MAAAGGSVDAVLCDMAPNTIGRPSADHSLHVKVRYGYHTGYRLPQGKPRQEVESRANKGKKSHKDVEATIIHHFNTYTNITTLPTVS